MRDELAEGAAESAAATGVDEGSRLGVGGPVSTGRELNKRRTAGTGRPADLVSIGAAAVALGVSERALRYYQQLGLISCGRTPGGTRRYSEADLARVARIRELQSLLGLELDEIAVVLANDDRLAEIRQAYHDERTGDARTGLELARECLALLEHLRVIVRTKQAALGKFLADLDERAARARDVLK